MNPAAPVFIRPLAESDAIQLQDLKRRNRDFFAPYEPLRPDSYFTLETQLETIRRARLAWDDGSQYSFAVFETETGAVVGQISLSNVVRGAWQSCTIGYSIDRQANGRGYGTAATLQALQFAFESAKLHRVQAAVMPYNPGSLRVIEKCGFLYEGLARYYLNIHGRWQDHKIFSRTVELWRPDAG